jgi:uncharacterized Zn finger protein (UPF0148 family)
METGMEQFAKYWCRHCGAPGTNLLDIGNGKIRCKACGTVYIKEQESKRLTDEVRRLNDEVKKEHVSNARKNLYQELSAKYINSKRVISACDKIKEYLPDDFVANFYLAANSENLDDFVNALIDITPSIAAENYPFIEGIVNFTIKSLDSRLILPLENLIDNAYYGIDDQKRVKFRDEIEAEALKIQEGLYDPTIERDIFVLYSSADMQKVLELVDFLEGHEGLSCFIARRNLQVGRHAEQDYESKIYTAMDHGVQQILDEYYSDIYNFPVDSEGNMAQSSMIVIDPYTSDILGVAGAVGQKKGNRIQNYATDSKRPSGSAIKPISVYAPAFEKGIINWSTIICDSPVRVATESSKAWPSNANNVYIGDVTIKYAIQNSLNTVAVKVLNMYGRRESFDFLTHRLKIRNLDPVKDMGEASLALGQHSNGITLRELTSSYSIFAEGMASVSRSYFKVTDTEGRIILDNPLDQEFAISPENAAIMTKLLQAVVTSGTASGKINLTSRCEVAGKTGTTQNNFDRYFVGYTPDILAGVWFGYEYPRPLREFGGNFAITVWDEVMQQIYSLPAYEKFKSQFTIPESIGKLTYNTKTGEPPKSGESAMDWEEGWFLQQNK